MIAYTMLGSNDIKRSEAFYAPLMTLLGGVEVKAYRSDKRFWFSGAQSPMPMLAVTEPHDGAPATVGNGSMLALVADSRATVDATHARALELGGADEGAPGVRGDDPNGFYGAYFRDPDGNKICVFRVGPA